MKEQWVPYTRLFVNNTCSVALSADGHINVLDSTGNILNSSFSCEEGKKIEKSGSLVGAAADENLKLLVTACSDKTIRVWEIEGLRLVSERKAPKKPTAVSFTRDAQTILVSDKFGDVHSYPTYVSSELAQTSTSVASSSGASKSRTKAALRMNDGSLLLGHVSVLTAHLLSRDERFIITADRDEHIRVSWYPEAYNIETYCLGNKKFISALHIPQWDPSYLISGGGDTTLKIWNWMEGIVLQEIHIEDTVMPYIKVVRGRGEDGRSDGEGEGEYEAKLSSRQRKKLRKKAKNSAKEKDEGTLPGEIDVGGKEDGKEESRIENDEPDNSEAREKEPLLAVQKIATVQCASNRFLVFSAHGATSLFYCAYPELSDTLTSTPAPLHVHSVPLDKPVLDFTIWPDSDEIWVVVDAMWSANTISDENAPTFVRTIKILGFELRTSEDSTHQSLIAALNTAGLRQAAPEAMKQIDLYSALIMLPKNADAEHNAMDVNIALPEASKGRQLSNKELGRLKSKKVVLALQNAMSSTPDDAHGEGPEPKKQRSVIT